MREPELRKGEIQHLVLTGAKREKVYHRILCFDKPEGARQFLSQYIASNLTCLTADKLSVEKPIISIGLTYRGLKALCIPDRYLNLFAILSKPFADGAPMRAGTHLGDMGKSAPRHWDAAFALPHAHALISIHANSGAYSEASEKLEAAITNPDYDGIRCVGSPIEGQHLGAPPNQTQSAGSPTARWVHFGYRDNLTRPVIGDLGDGINGAEVQKAGELLLGEPRNIGDNPWNLTKAKPKVRDFFKHGSFGVFRQIEQEAKEFDDQITIWAEQLINDKPMLAFTKDKAREFIKAKLCGRWPNGEPVQPSDLVTGPETYQGNEPPSYEHDKFGFGCPVGSHIRRMNPRDETVVQFRSRVLFRRGTPYGEWLDNDNTGNSGPKGRGLLGLFFCSDLQDQFEHLLGQWGNRRSLGAKGSLRAKDPLIGNHDDPKAAFRIAFALDGTDHKSNRGSNPVELDGFRSFTYTRGTVYCFYPTKTCLDLIVRNDWREEREPNEHERPIRKSTTTLARNAPGGTAEGPLV